MRVGPRMRDVVDFVRANPGRPKMAAAGFAGPHGSTRYGYRTVDRCIRAGLVVAHRVHCSRYELWLPEDIAKMAGVAP